MIVRVVCDDCAHAIAKASDEDRHINLTRIAKSASEITIRGRVLTLTLTLVLTLILTLIFEHLVKVYLEYSVDIDDR